MMWEAAARKIEDARRPPVDGSRIGRLAYDLRKALAYRGGERRRRREHYTARHVISSAPVRELIGKIIAAPSSLHTRAELRYRDFLTVALMVKKPEVFPDNWIYIHDPAVKVGRVQNFGSWSPEMVPDGMSCLGLEYFCFEGDGLWKRPMRT